MNCVLDNGVRILRAGPGNLHRTIWPRQGVAEKLA